MGRTGEHYRDTGLLDCTGEDWVSWQKGISCGLFHAVTDGAFEYKLINCKEFPLIF